MGHNHAKRVVTVAGQTNSNGYQEYSFSRLFVPWNIRSHDGTFVLGTIRSLELSFLGPFVPGPFVP